MGNENMGGLLAQELCAELAAATAASGGAAQAAWEDGEEAWVAYLGDRLVAGLEAAGGGVERWRERSPYGSSEVLRTVESGDAPSVVAVLSGPRGARPSQVLYDLWKTLCVDADARIVVASPDPALARLGPPSGAELAEYLRDELASRFGLDGLVGRGGNPADAWLLLGAPSEPWRVEAGRLRAPERLQPWGRPRPRFLGVIPA